MRGLSATCLLLAAPVFVHTAPGVITDHAPRLSLDTTTTRHNFPRSAFASLIDWSKRSFGHAAELLINWLPQHAPVSDMSVSWHENGAYNLEDFSRENASNACTNPTVRREWRSLSVEQREAWISAIHCLATRPSSGHLAPSVMPTNPWDANPPLNKSGSWYDDLSYVHIDMNSQIHQTGFFYPWHRYFLWSFENIIRDQCGFAGVIPYWDWTKDADDFGNATIFHPSTSVSGLGGFGGPEDDFAVRDGAFAGLQLAYPSPHTLRRQYTPYPFLNMSSLYYPDPNKAAASAITPEEAWNITHSFRGDFKAFQTYSERLQGPHMSIHLIMGGELGGSCPKNAPPECVDDAKWSPNDPMFWMHHGMLDKLWSDWQNMHPENFEAFEAGTIRDWITWPKNPVGAPPAMTPDFLLPPNGILLGNYTIQDMFNTTSNAPLCYTYA